MLLKALWGLSFLFLGVAAYQAQVGHDIITFFLLWAFALTMMTHRMLSYRRVRRNLDQQ
jgi:hypothetical protein